MTDKTLGKAIDIDAYFELLQQPQPQATEPIISMPTFFYPGTAWRVTIE
jgi:hypothetical protein